MCRQAAPSTRGGKPKRDGESLTGGTGGHLPLSARREKSSSQSSGSARSRPGAPEPRLSPRSWIGRVLDLDGATAVYSEGLPVAEGNAQGGLSPGQPGKQVGVGKHAGWAEGCRAVRPRPCAARCLFQPGFWGGCGLVERASRKSTRRVGCTGCGGWEWHAALRAEDAVGLRTVLTEGMLLRGRLKLCES